MCLCVLVCKCGVQGILYHVVRFFFRLMSIFIGLTDFVNCEVFTLVDEIPRYRNYHYDYQYVVQILRR